MTWWERVWSCLFISVLISNSHVYAILHVHQTPNKRSYKLLLFFDWVYMCILYIQWLKFCFYFATCTYCNYSIKLKPGIVSLKKKRKLKNVTDATDLLWTGRSIIMLQWLQRYCLHTQYWHTNDHAWYSITNYIWAITT